MATSHHFVFFMIIFNTLRLNYIEILIALNITANKAVIKTNFIGFLTFHFVPCKLNCKGFGIFKEIKVFQKISCGGPANYSKIVKFGIKI